MFAGEKFNTGTAQIPFLTDSLGTILNWLAEHGVVVKSKNQLELIEPRNELTEDEQLLVNTYMNALSKESQLVMEAVSKAMYIKLKGEVYEN